MGTVPVALVALAVAQSYRTSQAPHGRKEVPLGHADCTRGSPRIAADEGDDGTPAAATAQRRLQRTVSCGPPPAGVRPGVASLSWDSGIRDAGCSVARARNEPTLAMGVRPTAFPTMLRFPLTGHAVNVTNRFAAVNVTSSFTVLLRMRAINWDWEDALAVV